MPAKKTSTAKASGVRKPRVRKLKVKSVREEVKVDSKPNKVVVFQKHKVLKILKEGHTKTDFHCQMEGGFTQHVPKRLF